MNAKKLWKEVGLFVVGMLGFANCASAIDTQPLDFIPAPPGTNGALLYGLYSNSNGAHINGAPVQGTLDSYVLISRYVHYFDLFGATANFNFLLPVGSMQRASVGGASMGDTTGVGDLEAIGTLWLVNNPTEGKYLAIAGYLGVPTGSYNANEQLNMGGNRLFEAIQLGGVYRFAKGWFIEGVADVTFYGDNTKYGSDWHTLCQETTYTVQTWLTYAATDKLNLSVGYGGYWGGAQSANGTPLGFNSEKQQVRVAASYFLTPTFQVLAQLNHDFAVSGGFDQNFSGTLRLVKIL